MQVFGNQVRFGILSAAQGVGYEDYLKLWRTVESLGFDLANVSDHFIGVPVNGLPPTTPIFEGLTLLSALAVSVPRIRCSILVVGNTYRNPGMLAKIVATIDHVSGGRAELGMGAAWYEAEHNQFGIPFPKPGRRIRMLGESLKIIRSLFTQPRTTFHGRYYTIEDAIFEPKPLQAHLPLLVGGAGEQLTLRVVAESADLWNHNRFPPDVYDRKLAALNGHCRDVGRDPWDVRRQVNINALVGETEAEVREREAELGPNPRRIAGTPEPIIEELLSWTRRGVADFIIEADYPTDFRSLEVIGAKVIPAVKAEGAAILGHR